MNSATIGIIGLYLIFVGFQGNGEPLMLLIESTLPGYLSVFVVAAVLYELAQVPDMKDIAIVLAIIIVATLFVGGFKQANGLTAMQNISAQLGSVSTTQTVP